MNFRNIASAAGVALLFGLTACNKDETSSSPTATTNGTTSGSTSGSTSGTTSGNMVGIGDFGLGPNIVNSALVQCSTQAGIFKMDATMPNGFSVTLYLGGGIPTVNRIYQVVAFTGQPGLGQANIIAIDPSQTGTNAYMAVGGEVRIFMRGDEVVAEFGMIPMTNPQTGGTTHLYANLFCG